MGTKRIGRVGERDAGFHSNGALPSALSCCHYGSEVFRSCRKQSYDSETTEDETTEPQMETKEGPGRHQDKAGRRGPSGEGGGMMDYNPDASDRRATLPGAYDPVVERELRALGSRPPGLHPDPANPARTQTADSRVPLSSPSTHKNSIQDPDKTKPSDPQSSKTEQASGANSVAMTPELARAAPKIFDKVLAFEGADGGRVPQKRAAFKQQRASSLEDQTSYSQKVQSYQSKFAEELQRIRRLVGKPSLRKAYSTEQLAQKERLGAGKLEPIPPQVLKKLEARERALGDATAPRSRPERSAATRPDSQRTPAGDGSSRGSEDKMSVAMETAHVNQLPGQPLPTATRKSITRETLQSSAGAEKDAPANTALKSSSPARDLRTESTKTGDRAADHAASTHSGKRASPVTVREPGSQFPPKPPRLAPSPTPSVSPLTKRRKAEAGRTSPATRANVPTILLEDEPMETESVADGSKTRRKEGKDRKKEGRSSDDEEPAGGPSFKRTLVDTTASSGSEVTPTCIITGSPPPSEPAHMHCGKRVGASDVRSPARPGERDPSLQEEAMELRHSTAVGKRVHFKESPSFQVAPCDQEVTQGQEVVLSAKVAGHPKPMVYWLKDRVSVKTAGRFAARETGDGDSEMRIVSAQRADAGLYVCKIINEYGCKEAECRVEVKASAAQAALRITREVKEVAVKAGESATFECHMTGPPDVDVDWLSHGKLIQPALLNCKMHFDGKRCRLLLNSVHEDDSGTYTCKLSTAKEESTSSATLSVAPSKEPLFTRKLDVLEVIEGRSARFDCKVSGSPAPRVTWLHFEATVEESDNVRLLQEGGRHSLVIARVSGDTEGFYTAVAQNCHGTSECTAELYMQEPRAAVSSHLAKLEKMPSIPEEPEVLESEVEKRTMPDFVKPLADAEVIAGKEALLSCKVAGLPYPTIAWYHNGKRIESGEERNMTQHRDVHSMVIRSACHAHGGVYKAVIANKLGKAACYAHLYVTDIVPDPPDGPPVIEAITGKTISLSWKRPKRLDSSFDAGSLLYVVQQQPLGSIQWSVVASNLKETNYVATSLSKGVRYAFRTLTSTGKMLSKPSPSTDLVQLLDRGPYLRKAPVILDKPDVIYVVENQPASITVTLNHVHAVVTWKRRGVVLVNRLGMYELSMPDDDQHTLKLQRVRSADFGQLVVTASNQFGSDLCTLQLAMAVPPKFETIMEDVDVHIGETSRLAVVVEGKPDPDILWEKDDVRLSESNHFTFVYDDPEYSLVVLNARPEHSGVYTCTAKNLAGSNSCKAELTVHTEQKEAAEPMEDEGSILRKMRRLTDYYDIHKELGRGAFSYVKRVIQQKGKAEFAAKFISAGGRRKAAALAEMQLLSELDHERILYFHDAFEKKSVVVLITELCHEELLERMAKKTSVKELEIRWSLQQLLEGLRYLHQKNIAHLDVKPENILMASPASDLIRICDFGSAARLEASEERYCKYGTPEYVAPEIVNQTPVSTATDIWAAGVITYLCLTGVSPFAGENDRATALNIRNYNVAFEESMFADLCKEAKGFVIKLLVADRLRPSATECLRHPWFKSSTNKSISTAKLKQVLSRRRWQRSLISYKSKMVMRSIPELLNEASKHVSIAVARHLKEGSPPPSSSSDSDADVDELPFIPMPLSMVFSGSRVSLNEIPGDEDVGTRKRDNEETAGARGGANKGVRNEEETPVEEEKTKEAPLQKESSVEAEEESQIKARRAKMRRGSSADSALLLHIDPEEENAEKESEESNKSLKKAVSMELPNRSPSPGPAKLSQEDYALKLELMRQRLLRGGSVDKKMSGLRGPLFETLGMEDERRTGSLDRNTRRSRAGPPLARAASSESAGEDAAPKTKVLRKSTSFTQGDSEPMPLHRRFGAPLEIPAAGDGCIEGKKLQEATSMSAIAERAPESASASPTRKTSFILPTAGRSDRRKDVSEREDTQSMNEKNSDGITEERTETQSEMRSPSVVTPVIVIEEDDDDDEEGKKENCINEKDKKGDEALSRPSSAYASVIQAVAGTKSTESLTLPEHPAVFAKVAPVDRSPASVSAASNPDLAAAPRHPVLRTDIKDIDSEEVFEARFRKRESSLTRGLRKLTRNKSEEKSPVLNRKGGEAGEEVYRPGARGAPLEMLPKGLQEKSKSVQDLREDEAETGFSLIGRFSLRSKRSASVEKNGEKPKEEQRQDAPKAAVNKRVSWSVGRSKSLDAKELSGAGAQRPPDEREQRKADESSVSAMRRKFESKVAGISAKMRTQSEERKDRDGGGSQRELLQKDLKKVTDSPVLAMRHKFEDKVAAAASKGRSQSEERKEGGEGKRMPLFTRHRHSQSEGRGLKGMGVPENQLAKQTAGATASKESIGSASSIHSEKAASETDRRSRWDRWGLTRGRKDKTPSQADPAPKEAGASGSQQFIRSASDFAPVFHIKLKDHVLLEGEPVTLSCLPAGSPHPDISWAMDRKPLQLDERINLMSHPDGRQLLMIMKTSRRDAGVYECVAVNPIATITTSCTLTIACVPKRPGTPEVPQTYNNTALVLWKPADTKSPCSYTLERKTEGDSTWLTVATGVVDCYYNVTDLPPGGAFKFRVACINKAGQSPYSSASAPVSLDSTAGGAPPAMAVVKTVPAPHEPVAASPSKPVQTNAPSTAVSSSADASPLKTPPSPPSSPATDPQLPSAAAPIISSSHPSSPAVKAPPPFVLPKPQSPVNVVSPMTQSPPAAPPPALATPPSTPIKPAASSVPTYVPAVTARVTPTPTSFTPQVLQSSSLSPFGDGAGRGTPSGRTTPSTALRQGVPQKPYTFLEEKARGRFGVVRECRENATGKIYMAKIVSYNQENKPQVLKEYEILKSLHNEKVMALHEAYVTPHYLVLVAEYCTGKELLYSLIDRFRYSEDDVVGYLVQILQGVEYLHNRRVLHLDLKPDNIMVTNLNAVKIVDFGSAQSFNPLSLKRSDPGDGTLEYMAPEMVKGEVVGPPSDIWTVGVVTFIMLSGRLPFEDKDPLQVESKIQFAKFDPTKLYPNVSQSASAVLKKMLSSYPWARPTTRDCFTQAWLQDSYLMKLRRQTLTFPSSRLKEFLVEQQGRRTEDATKHKVLLRAYQSAPASGTAPK
ncbi:striated muscle preferentially expressed protein kinase isoform X2 [Clinocottus analis]|uniref:striated muscle preferentially expressed protein kinase isoform X2 n=1 Tax=Clinocottus analis TaxID=304258 RepID=UPI0035C226E8